MGGDDVWECCCERPEWPMVGPMVWPGAMWPEVKVLRPQWCPGVPDRPPVRPVSMLRCSIKGPRWGWAVCGRLLGLAFTFPTVKRAHVPPETHNVPAPARRGYEPCACLGRSRAGTLWVWPGIS